LENTQNIDDSISVEKIQNLRNSAFVAIERHITYSKLDKTSQFEKIVKKGKMMVKKENLSAKGIWNDTDKTEQSNIEKDIAKAVDSQMVPEYSLLSESVNLTSLSSIVAVKA